MPIFIEKLVRGSIDRVYSFEREMLKKIRHFSHQHDLQLLDGGLEAPCGICNRLIPNDKNRYFCGICGQYRIHEKCAEWLEYMNHSLHPLHPLKLAKRSLNNNSCCYYCEEPFNNDDGHVYGCDDQQCSNVYMHRSCAMIPLLTIASDVDVVCHQKPMILTEHLDCKKIRAKCFACQLGWSSGSTYSCTSPACENFLHKSCAEFPRKIQHPFHPHNSLILQVSKPQLCRSCCTKNRLVYSCLEKSCTFNLGIECASLDITWVKCQSHDHSLSLVEKSSCVFQCDACQNSYKNQVKYVPDEVIHTQSFMFRCMNCVFNYHFLCGPLPTTVKYEYHMHPLILSNHSATEDGSDEYYCDVCEEKRDKSFRIYYCEECTYAAHIHCLISEIMKVIKGDNKEVVLRALGEERWDQYLGIMESKSMDLTLKHIMDELTQQEEEMLIHPFGFDDHMSNNRRSRYLYYQQLNSRFNLEGSNEDVDKLVQFFLLNAKSDDDFQNFDNELWYFTPEEEGGLLKLLEDKYLRQEVVDVDGYMVPKRLAPVLKAFLHKYGDLRGEKSLSSAMKSITSTLLCTVFDRMCRTKVEDITRDDLKHLHFYLDGIRKITGFNIGRFLFDYVRSPSRFPLNPFLGFEAIRYETKICENLDNKIATLEAELERCKKNREQLKSETHRSQGSDYMKLCLREASKWKNNKLLDQFGNVDGVCIFCLAENSSTILEEAIQASNGVTRFDNHVPDSISLCDICDNNCHKDRVLSE
ncbi:uncharacterized protein LOC21401719 [Morus notabilis]|uniref:uncharacterized protein LOC21401719 n=1 Tax=Morus notabilis TaxID=981085 RepID=UPI000CED0D23|nr:uncharacterized protein LOC21401719 [Morus notabilis]